MTTHSPNSTVTQSGEGTRPTTDGTVDNIGAGEKFTTRRNAAGAEINGGPAPKEHMQDKRKDAEATRHSDSAAFDLTEDLTPTNNVENHASKPSK